MYRRVLAQLRKPPNASRKIPQKTCGSILDFASLPTPFCVTLHAPAMLLQQTPRSLPWSWDSDGHNIANQAESCNNWLIAFRLPIIHFSQELWYFSSFWQFHLNQGRVGLLGKADWLILNVTFWKSVPTISSLNAMIVKSFRVLTVNSVHSWGKAQNKTGIYVSGCIKLLLHQKNVEIFSFSSAWAFFFQLHHCIHPIAKIWQEGRSNLPKSDNHFSTDPKKIASWNLWTHRRDPHRRVWAAWPTMWGPPAAGQQTPTWW